MRPEQIEIGAEYRCRLERGVVRVRVDGAAEGGGWMVTDVEAGQPEHVRRHEQFRERWSTPAPAYPADVAETIAETGAYPPPLDRIDGERLANDVKSRPAEFDPDRCATPRCKREPAMTYLGKPLCQACWEAATRETTNDGAESAAKETTMSKKSASKKTTKTSKATKTTKGKKPVAAKPKAERKPAGDAKSKRLSALDAAAEVLRKSGKPMRSQEMIAAMAEQGLWSSPNGKTPQATLYAAILREIGTKRGAARFKKVERGQFAFNG
ncbi:MAG: winged helix-turn-helix domain-containing protein [Planctomycetes bacterium]|nr:winged helix-turn-helix domain-containing protein [Planctomycetota bacterium]